MSDQRARAALVTGGAVRIGRAIVDALVDAGYAVAIHSNNSRDAAAAAPNVHRNTRPSSRFDRAGLTACEIRC